MRWELDWSGRESWAFPGEFIPDPAQLSVIEHRAGSLAILGAAGSGKTRTLIHAVASRMQAGVDPSTILVLTFGKRAVREFREGLAAITDTAVLPTIGTFHSLAYSLVSNATGATSGLAVLSGAEEDARIIEIIRGLREDSSHDWPPAIAAAAETRSFAREMRAVIARLKDLRLTGEDLVQLGIHENRPEWVVAGKIATNEAEVMHLQGTVDYSELLIQAASEVADSPPLRSLTHLIIDEYQEISPLQHELVQEIFHVAGHGRGITELLVAANPNESIFTFRGAQTRYLDQFASDFPPADSVYLTSMWRSGVQVARAAESVFPDGAAIPYQHFPAQSVSDRVVVHRYGSRNARAAFIAQEIRTAHVEQQVPWRSMVVIGRATSDLPSIIRALSRANVPVVVGSDDIPLVEEPAVGVLLTLLWAALAPENTSVHSVHDLLSGPLCGLDASDIRRLGRALRAADRNTPSAQLIRELILHGNDSDFPAELAGSGYSMNSGHSDLALRVTRLQGLLRELRSGIARQVPVPDLLWLAWTGGKKYSHGWPDRLRESALHHSAQAHHDLDAIMAFFDTADRFSSRGRTGLSNFLLALKEQKLPAEPVAARGLRADAVQVMTVHHSKGQQWDRVWITGLEEGIWPNLVVRGSILHPDEITATGAGSGANPIALLREERNLFYVAATRARQQVTFTCIDQGEEGGDQPSRFVHDLIRIGVPDQVVTGYPRSRSSWSGLAAELRSVLANPESSVSLQQAAGELLHDMGHSVGPDTWWGLPELTRSTRPIRPRDQPLHMSGSSLDSLITCPLKWFLDKEVKAQVSRGAATAFGSIVHAVAEYVAKGEVPDNVEAMQALINNSWRNVVYESHWQSASELAHAREAASRFLRYHHQSDRVYLEAEQLLTTEVQVTTPSGDTDTISLTGFVDRVERDPSGRLVAIDLKNMKTAVPTTKIPEHGQLGVYQLLLQDRQPDAVTEEHAEQHAEEHTTPDQSIGAALVQLRVEDKTGMPKIQGQAAIDFGESPSWIEQRLGEAAEIIRNEEFIPIPGEECRYCSYHSVCPVKSGTVFQPLQPLDDNSNDLDFGDAHD
jgi:superfamily I DNA/RNA helicase/RecB family exonuclease